MGFMKANPRERPCSKPVVVRRADDGLLEDAVAVVVPDSGADVEAVERALIEFALERSDGNRTHAARFLGLSRSALIYRMHKHGLIRSTAGTEPVGSEGSSHQ